MSKGIFSKSLFVLLLGAVLLSLPMETFAQRRVKPSPKKVKIVAPKRRAPKVVKLPADHKTIVVGGINYYHHRGVFYKKGPAGYVVVRAPIGARIKTLPSGHVTLHIGARPYYYYYGTYYVHHPDEDVYVVVDAPTEGENSYEGVFDRITLVDGSIIEGLYLGGTANTVQFEIAGEIMESSVAEVISVTFAPPISE